ncbi:hypothetical protein HanPI659440_Chr04g0162451 [Helianthus annuus]|nr:hypothetical protein HanPI659440_Chr04g0162451 [Helianthus annuus]
MREIEKRERKQGRQRRSGAAAHGGGSGSVAVVRAFGPTCLPVRTPPDFYILFFRYDDDKYCLLLLFLMLEWLCDVMAGVVVFTVRSVRVGYSETARLGSTSGCFVLVWVEMKQSQDVRFRMEVGVGNLPLWFGFRFDSQSRSKRPTAVSAGPVWSDLSASEAVRVDSVNSVSQPGQLSESNLVNSVDPVNSVKRFDVPTREDSVKNLGCEH